MNRVFCSLWLFVATLPLLCSSCTKDTNNEIIDGTGEAEEEYVTIGVSAVDVEMSVSPLTKSSSSDLYGLEIKELDFKIKDNDTVRYIPKTSSHAVFFSDNLNTTIRLKKDKMYDCCLVYIPNGKNLIYVDQNQQYGNPFFSLAGASPVFSTDVYYGGYDMDFAVYGAAQAADKSSYHIQSNFMNTIDIYYGCRRIKATENKNIVINLYRMMYGLDVSVSNIAEGKVHIYDNVNKSLIDARDYGGYVYSISPESQSLSLVLELKDMPWFPSDFGGVSDKEIDPIIKDWSSNQSFNVDYEYPNGDIVRLFNKKFIAKRATKYTMTFDLSEYLDEINDSFQDNVVDDEWNSETLN